MIYLYTRTSVDTAPTDEQMQALRGAYPGATVVSDLASGGGKMRRPGLEGLLARLCSGDRVVAYSLDSLGHSPKNLIGAIETIIARGAVLEVHREGVTYDSATGPILVQVLDAVAKLGRDLVSARTKAALRSRMQKGMKAGRPVLMSDEQLQRLSELLEQGVKYDAIALEIGVSAATVCRWKRRLAATGRSAS